MGRVLTAKQEVSVKNMQLVITLVCMCLHDLVCHDVDGGHQRCMHDIVLLMAYTWVVWPLSDGQSLTASHWFA